MKCFMYLSIGILCLALAALIGFEIGSQRVEAQPSLDGIRFSVSATQDKIGGARVYCFATLPNGDVYDRQMELGNLGWHFYPLMTAYKAGNFWEGATAANKPTRGTGKGN
jgi:hypothetical protein